MEDVLGNVFKSVLGLKGTLEASIEDIKNLVGDGQDAYADPIEFLIFATRRAPLSLAGQLQDLWVLFELGEKRNGYFVEFGTSNGLAASNTVLLERFYGWRGAIAEPARSRNEQLRASRDCYVTDKFIYQDDGLKILFSDPGASESAAKDASGGAEQPSARRSGRRYEVETLSLRSFLQAAGAPQTIDYMSIRAEDDTFDVLTRFDFSERDVKLLSVAYGDEQQRADIRDLLARNGYEPKFKTFSASEDWFVKGERAAAAQSAAA